ncbi:hypothetical protein QN366_01390 [Pseudomonas sp. CCC3.2]|uniref:hypothetical protein n=1 Tax=unclassified Pseudomonas TaxID=196821 RepID=UPI002AB4EF41|nr:MULTISPECIES: hypothetical protein [unclassified Pseudomonas]MDY7560174.1 hypothetical protein [Pseudomonas sp. AB6]MEB0178723.1 hypothetical protein [Pseudomonas sp. CCC3.2]MEB0211361.1 hypothetical protein [Pseudomonas sp. AB6]
MKFRNGPVGQRLIELFNALQIRETTFVRIEEMASACGIDPRRLLADHFGARS